MRLNIGVIGAGHMGSAMIRGWLNAGWHNIHVLDPAVISLPVKQYTDPKQFYANVDIIFIAVRPDTWQDIKTTLPEQHLKISVMAGIGLSDLTQVAGPWARIMPNLPVAQGLGTVAVYSESEQEQLLKILQPLGAIFVLDDEALLHGFTAIAGSGPAWLWQYMSEWINAAEQIGFSTEQATSIVTNVIKGTIAATNTAPVSLCNAVASVGGTTAAGLEVLRHGGDLKTAILAALARSKELATQ